LFGHGPAEAYDFLVIRPALPEKLLKFFFARDTFQHMLDLVTKGSNSSQIWKEIFSQRRKGRRENIKPRFVLV
jgi:hypothetical protein